MKKRGLIIAILVSLTIVYPLAAHYAIQAYQSWRNAGLEAYPEEMRPYVETSPFIQSFWGGLTVIFGAFIASSWLLVGIWRKKLMLLIIFVLLTPLTAIPSAYAGYWETTMDILAVQDEEFIAEYPIEFDRYLSWEIYIYDAFDRFRDTFNVNFELRGWINWDSSDSEHDVDTLLDEAIRETGFVSHQTSYNGYVIDILMVFSGQLDLWDQDGFSPPDWKALILKGWSPNYPRTQMIMHEFSHQFMASHCTNVNSCVMDMANSVYYPRQWCNSCQATINDNKDRFWRWVDTSGGGGGGGGHMYPVPYSDPPEIMDSPSR